MLACLSAAVAAAPAAENVYLPSTAIISQSRCIFLRPCSQYILQYSPHLKPGLHPLTRLLCNFMVHSVVTGGTGARVPFSTRPGHIIV